MIAEVIGNRCVGVTGPLASSLPRLPPLHGTIRPWQMGPSRLACTIPSPPVVLWRVVRGDLRDLCCLFMVTVSGPQASATGPLQRGRGHTITVPHGVTTVPRRGQSRRLVIKTSTRANQRAVGLKEDWTYFLSWINDKLAL